MLSPGTATHPAFKMERKSKKSTFMDSMRRSFRSLKLFKSKKVPATNSSTAKKLNHNGTDPTSSDSNADTPPPLPPKLSKKFASSITEELQILSNYGWYWGPLSYKDAEEALKNQSDGTFLLRDSTDDNYILSVTFRWCDKIYHSRISVQNGCFYLMSYDLRKNHTSLVELITETVKNMEFAYSHEGEAALGAAQLRNPLSRFTVVQPLQKICRFVIRQNISVNNIDKLPLPVDIQRFLREKVY